MNRFTTNLGQAAFVAALAAAPLAAQEGVQVFQGARIHPVSGPVIEDGVVIVSGGRIVAVGGSDLETPSGAQIIDCSGKVITPGLVDAGTTIGVATTDKNEQGEEVTPAVRITDAIDPASRDFERARAVGVTTVQINPGNRNVIGGFGAVVKTAGDTLAEMLVSDESGLRLTMGSEPSSGNRAIRGGRPEGIYYRRPTTRMGVVWEARKAFYDAQAYMQQKTDPNADPEMIAIDPGMEVLSRALKQEVLVRTTARAEQDIRTALRLAEEFGYKTLVEEATEVWRVIDDIAAAEVPVLLSAPSAMSGGEGTDVRYHTIVALAERGIPFAICTGANGAPLPLIHEATFAVRYGLSKDVALAAVTLRAAEILGIDDRVGSLRPGRDADLVVWSGDPFDPTTRPVAVYVSGEEVTE